MDVDQIFKEGGPLSKLLPTYTSRPGQLSLAKAVEVALQTGKHLVAEGPTGTGKSMAYGIPVALHVLNNKQTVIIATANIALQEQLYKKDLPLVAKVMETLGLGPLKFYSRKGLSNYVCRYKLHELASGRGSPGWARTLHAWVEENNQGDKEELPVDYHEVWPEVSANNDECHRDKCRFFNNCFAMRSRDIDPGPCIIVTNYHLLYTNCVILEKSGGEASLLPSYSVVVMDEAHEAVDLARGFQGFELSMGSIRWASNRMLKVVKSTRAKECSDQLIKQGTEFFNTLQGFHAAHEGILEEPLGFGLPLIEALKECGSAARAWGGRIYDTEEGAMAVKLAEHLYEKAAQFKEACFGEPKEKPVPGEEPEIGAFPEGSVYYVEYQENRSARICKKMIEVQEFIRREFLDSVTLVATSATLSTNGHFGFVAKEFGLEKSEYTPLISPSPFNPRKMLVVIPHGCPSPKDRNRHIVVVAQGIELVVKGLGGRSMALFTSYKSLKFVETYLSTRLPGITLLVQGKLPRGKIVERLKSDERSLILATASFWQGIDIPGRALSCLFIEKLPFAPPTDPVACYLQKKLEKETGSGFASFLRYSVPRAVISLKQGVGRLIRKESDYGSVVLFDPRVDTESYGEHFQSAFPNDHYRADKLPLVLKFIKEHDDEVARERPSKESAG